jgi:hypothetical protein
MGEATSVLGRRAGSLLLALAAVPAVAGSVMRIPPHDAHRARGAVERVVALIDRNDLRAWTRAPGMVSVFTSNEGLVLGEEDTRAFLGRMNANEGRNDRAPLRVGSLRVIQRDRTSPVYLAEIVRQKWFEAREEELNGHVPPRAEGYRQVSETWLVGFVSNEVSVLREVPELWRLARGRD